MSDANDSSGLAATGRLEAFCTGCGAALMTHANFCAQCGQHATGPTRPSRSRLDLAAPALGSTGAGGFDGGGSRALDDRMASSRRAWLGRIVDGRYRVLECIGQGGMGVIYRVEHVRLGKHAAMKVLHSDLADRREVVARFEREAHAVSRLTHPNSIGVFDFGSERGQLYLVMELVRGVDLARLIERDGPMPWLRALPLLVQICASLTEAHGMNIVHRDLKPDNILLTRDASHRDFVKVLDFGLAALLERDGGGPAPLAIQAEATSASASAPPSLTMGEGGEIVGTPYFMAPEQIRGQAISARTDLYSLGALMYQLLTGHVAFGGDSALDVLSAHLHQAPVPPAERAPLPRPLSDLILHCMAKEASDRPASAQEVAETLTRIFETHQESARHRPQVRSMVHQLPTTALSNSSWQLQRSDLDAFEQALGRRKWHLRVAAGAVAVGAIAAAVWFMLGRGSSDAPRRLEREPNNVAANATPIAVGTDVQGLLGKRHSEQQGDRDLFVAQLGEEPSAYAVSVIAPPNIDVALRFRLADGLLLAETNLGTVGDAEHLGARRLRGTVLIEVEAVTAPGAVPSENVSDLYTLTLQRVSEREGELAVAVEPNEGIADAVAVTSMGARGSFDADDDVETLRFASAAARYRIRLEASAVVTLKVDNKEHALVKGEATVDLQTGSLIQLVPAAMARRGRDGVGAWPTVAQRTAHTAWQLTFLPP
ncbi:MAG: protein kinase [Myxococcales bacterium]|nr:protein kinase [Myxococcales bacterium]